MRFQQMSKVQSIPPPEPSAMWGLDVPLPFPKMPHKHHYIFLTINYGSSFRVASACPTATTQALIQFLCNNMLFHFRNPTNSSLTEGPSCCLKHSPPTLPTSQPQPTTNRTMASWNALPRPSKPCYTNTCPPWTSNINGTWPYPLHPCL